MKKKLMVGLACGVLVLGSTGVAQAGKGNSSPDPILTQLQQQINALQAQLDAIQLTEGPKGDTGEPGPIGPQGPIGLTGDTGPQGLQGVAGDTGLTGPVGPKGDQGVVGPTGPKGDIGPVGATGGVNVYDASGQYLGIFMGEEQRRIQIFIPPLGKTLSLSKDDGSIPSTDTPQLESRFYYMTSDCTGQPYQVLEGGGPNAGLTYSSNGWLFENKDRNTPYKFFASNMVGERNESGPISAGFPQADGTFICGAVSFQNVVHSPVTQYTEADLPFTFPLTFPLSFEVNQ